MKIILSRKGFDSSNGGIPSPVFPDGTMLSLPIPTSIDKNPFSDLIFEGVGYDQIYSDLLQSAYPQKYKKGDPEKESALRKR